MAHQLNKITEQYVKTANQPEDFWDKTKFDNLNNVFGSKHKARAMMMTSSWQMILESPDLKRKIYPKNSKNFKSSSLKDPYMEKLEKYLLCLGDNKYCLMVFDPNFASDEPKYFDASKSNSKKSILCGYDIWKSKMKSSYGVKQKVDLIHNQKFLLPKSKSSKFQVRKVYLGKRQKLVTTKSKLDNDLSDDIKKIKIDLNLLNNFEPKVAYDGISNAEWPMIICKPPRKIFTSEYPTSPHKVVVNNEADFRSLAGVYTTNKDGVFGVTICYHCLKDIKIELGKTQIVVNGIEGTIISVNDVSDSCFVRLDIDESHLDGIKNVNGPLIGMTPREFEPCYFINKEGEKIDTFVIGWSPDLLYTDPYNQVKVLTKQVTNTGDSGSALLDTNGNVLGFSFYRTGINSIQEFSAWIWGAAVFQSHNLNY
jgi:hypothetical protein